MPSAQPKVKPNNILHVTFASDGEQSQAHEVLQPVYGEHSYSLGTSTAATQPQFFIPVGQTVRLVFSPSSKQLSSGTIYGELDRKHSYTFEITSLIPHTNQLTNIILFSTLLQTATASMITSQAIVYNAFAWSTCLLHHQIASATKALSKFPMYDCGSAQLG
jgi:hypothetical protein